MTRRWMLRLILGTSLLGMVANATAEDKHLRIGWTAWSDAEFVTKLTARLLETRMGYKVDLIQTYIAPQYQGLASGSIDVMLMSWQPNTHADYLRRTRGKIINLGILYTHARLGWAVPDYVPKAQLDSIADLKKPEVRKRLDRRITGIDPGAGLTRLSEKVLKEYKLNKYRLQTSSGAGMTAALDRAIRRKEWIVVTAWSPHWMFGAYKLRYLKDPKGVLGRYERVHAMARKGFYQDHIDAASMISRIQIPLDELQQAMYDARETSYDAAVGRYIKAHPKRIHYWITGKL
jgi:glycine betaine/proline transport system substrate-binding protein